MKLNELSYLYLYKTLYFRRFYYKIGRGKKTLNLQRNEENFHRFKITLKRSFHFLFAFAITQNDIGFAYCIILT